MGIESREPRRSGVYLNEVGNLARQLQSGSEAEQQTAREVLKGMRKKTLANIARLSEEGIQRDSGLGGAIKKLRPGETDVSIQELDKELVSLRAINVALGLEENDRSSGE